MLCSENQEVTHVLNHWDMVPEVVLVNDEIIVKQGGEKVVIQKGVVTS